MIFAGASIFAGGQVAFMAPEIISGWEYDERVDIWSIGLTTVMIVTKQSPMCAPRSPSAQRFHPNFASHIN